MMTRDELITLILNAIREFTELPDAEFDTLDETTRLIGENHILDSLGLVSVLMDVEQQVNEQLDVEIMIADERAMSQQRSPFRSVESLADYVLMLLHEQNTLA
jgi:acyl carrier protein